MKPSIPAAQMTTAELASYIDHSVLKPEFTPSEIRREVEHGIGYGCKTVCINPASVEIAAPLCAGTGTGMCVVVDFPFGCSSTASKVAQTRVALEAGIQELDIIANYGWIRGGELQRVEEDLRAVIEPCHEAGVLTGAGVEARGGLDESGPRGDGGLGRRPDLVAGQGIGL